MDTVCWTSLLLLLVAHAQTYPETLPGQCGTARSMGVSTCLQLLRFYSTRRQYSGTLSSFTSLKCLRPHRKSSGWAQVVVQLINLPTGSFRFNSRVLIKHGNIAIHHFLVGTLMFTFTSIIILLPENKPMWVVPKINVKTSSYSTT